MNTQDLPDRIVIGPSYLHLGCYALLAALLVVFGVGNFDRAIGLIATAFGSLALLLIGWRAFSAWRGKHALTLDRTGFRIVGWKDNERVQWQEIAAISLASLAPAPFSRVRHIRYIRHTDLADPGQSPYQTPGRKLEGVWSLDNEELCALMNAFRDRALKGVRD